ncbi:MAG: lipopolysaccharide heptosyltransferase II [Phycisphaerae bacterium]|nr:lipopolysaccharide heptosyltransferase II [Phycisphaerae bacterium]
MSPKSTSIAEPGNLLISIPNWVGDAVMATPALSAVRRRFPAARITFLLRRYVADVLAGTQLANDCLYWPSENTLGGHFSLLREMRNRRFDTALLLTNSFRSAFVVWLARVPRRIGYARDGRSWLLSDRLTPVRAGGSFVPVPAMDYYQTLARHIGCERVDDQMVLATSVEDEAAIDRRLGALDASRPLVVLNPGANFGSAKCWPPEKYAALADALTRCYGARVVASLGPKERHIAAGLQAAAKEPIEIFIDPPLGLGPLKALVRRSRLLITNDTGPRHFAPPFDVPVVTIYGSSDPAWTVTRFSKERNVMLKLACQPCMARTCPLKHHDCMRKLEPSLVLEAVDEFLSPWREGGDGRAAGVVQAVRGETGPSCW